MHIDKYKLADGTFQNENGASFDTLEDFIQMSVLCFCGCGMPRLALKHLQVALTQVKKRNELVPKDTLAFRELEKETSIQLGSNTAMWFMWYYLETQDLTEHGGSVPRWLTQKGKELLEDLDEYFKLEKS